MSQSRIKYVASMYSQIMGVTVSQAIETIENTTTGKAIAENNPTYLYDQPTSNLTKIVQELPREIQACFTKEKIVRAANIAFSSAPYKAPAAPYLKKAMIRNLQQKNISRLESEKIKMRVELLQKQKTK